MAQDSPDLYPAIEPYDVGSLKVSELHTLYYEQSGNPNGKPVVFLHGGPGGGTNPRCRRFFDLLRLIACALSQILTLLAQLCRRRGHLLRAVQKLLHRVVN